MSEFEKARKELIWYQDAYKHLSRDFAALRANLDIYREQLEVAREQTEYLKRIAKAIEYHVGPQVDA